MKEPVINIEPPTRAGNCNCDLCCGDPEKEGTYCAVHLSIKPASYLCARARPGPECPGPGKYKLVKIEADNVADDGKDKA